MGWGMAVTKSARNILYYDLVVTRRAQHAPFPALKTLANLWVKAHSAGDVPAKKFQNGEITAILKDVYSDRASDILTLLIELSDREAPDATYVNHSSRTSTHHPKATDEGSGNSAHVFISMKPNAVKPDTYMTLIEAIPAVSAQRIQAILNGIVKHYCEADPTLFTYQRPGGSKKEIPYQPHIALGGYPSDQFLKDIESGKIHGMTLVSPKVKAPLGQSPYLKLEQLTMKVKVSKDLPKGQRWQTLIGEAKLNKSDFPQVRISLQPEKNGKSVSVDVDADTGKIMGDGYIKVIRIDNINPPMSRSSPDKVASQLHDRVAAIIIKER